MSKKSVVKLEFKKHVAAIHTSGELTLLERKIVNVLLLNAYDDLLTKRSHSIPVQHMAEMLGWDASHNVERLQEALRSIVGTSIEFNVMEDGRESWEITNLLSYAKIRQGICTYKYVEELAERLFDPEVYATINIGMQRRFKGGYSLTLYENCLRYKGVGSTGFWDLEKFRRIMGADAPMYDEFKRLSHFVINKAVDEVNRQSDIHLTPEYQRIGRKVVAVKFLITENAQSTLLAPEQLDGNEAIRSSPTYNRLREHGIGDKLAVAWIIQDEQRARQIVEYVEEKDRKKQVKGSTAGYIRKLIEDKADVGDTVYEVKQEAAIHQEEAQVKDAARKQQLKDLQDQYQKHLFLAKLKSLTLEERQAHAQAWLKTPKGQGREASYNLATGDFRESADNLNFNHVYLREVLAVKPYLEAEFVAWVKTQKGIDLRGLGL